MSLLLLRYCMLNMLCEAFFACVFLHNLARAPICRAAAVFATLQVTSYKLAMSNAAEAVAGPTAGDGGALGVFTWKGNWENVAHRGQPEVFDFEFEVQKP